MARFSPCVVVAVLGALSLLAPAPRAVATAKTILPPPAGFANLYVKDLQLAQSHVTPGSRVSAKVTVSNEGSSNATATTLKMWFSHSASGSMLDAKADLLSSAPLGTIAPGRTVTYDTTVTVPKGPQPGSYRIFAYVATTATEHTLSNNKRAATVVLSAPSPVAPATTMPSPAAGSADLYVKDLEFSPSNVTAGSQLSAKVTVSNEGTSNATSTTLKVWFSHSATGSMLDAKAELLGSASLGTIGPGRAVTLARTVTVPKGSQPGTYRIFAYAETAATEYTLTRNKRAATLVLSAPSTPAGSPPAPMPAPARVPKADIVPSSLSLGSATVNTGGTTPVELTVANRGTATAGSVGVTISLVSGATTSKVASMNLGTLVAGASGTVVTTLTAPMQTGTYTVLATATTPDPETSTANNTTTTTLGVSGAPTPPPPGTSCDYYASPTGTGSGASASAPFRITNFWDVARPGKTLCLLDGTYRGADSLIAPGAQARGLSGTSGNPITVKALNDGAVTIDGQFTQIPVDIASGNNWWVIEGINAKNGPNMVVNVRGDDNIVRRVVAWDMKFENAGSIFSCQSTGSRNLFEDVAGFGVGAHMFSHSQNKQGSCTFRRAWGRFEGTANGNSGAGPFYGLFYNSYQTTCENCLGEYWANGAPSQYAIYLPTPTSGPRPITDGGPPIPTGGISINRWDGGSPNDFDGQVLGSIFYAKSDANLVRMTASSPSGGTLFHGPAGRKGGDMLFKDVVFMVDPAATGFSTIKGISVGARPHSRASTLTSISTVAGLSDSIDTSYWSVSDLVHATSLTGLNAANANPWTGSAGANLCHRYVNRARTNTPLWPWPMNQRIKEATGAAGAYNGPCEGCIGTFPKRMAVDVTADIGELLGPIPAACRR